MLDALSAFTHHAIRLFPSARNIAIWQLNQITLLSNRGSKIA
jgi:hypothetical protein